MPGGLIADGYRTVPGPVPYSTLMVPDAPTAYVVGPWGRVHHVRPAVVATHPYWYY